MHLLTVLGDGDYSLLVKQFRIAAAEQVCLQSVLLITLLKSKLRSYNPFGNANLTNEDRRQIAGESRQKLRVLTA